MASKSKKVDKEYILSDSTVNCYGFRLLTSGYLIDEFKKNPIGYYMHNRMGSSDDTGVVVRWDDLMIRGDKVVGKPVINLSNKRGQQTLEEVEGGFLNAASVGEIVVLEWSMEPEHMLAGQTGPTITKWYNKECSLVDIPGNSNALTKLFDKQDNPLQLADLMAGSSSTQNLIDSNMKQIQLPIIPALLANLKLKADATPTATEVTDSIQNLADLAASAETLRDEVKQLKADKTDLQTQVNTLKADGNKKEVDGILTQALADKKITNDLKATLATDYADNPDGLKKLVGNMTPQPLITDALKGGGQGAEDLSKKSWDELHKSNKLADLKASDPATYKALYKKEFGKDPKGM